MVGYRYLYRALADGGRSEINNQTEISGMQGKTSRTCRTRRRVRDHLQCSALSRPRRIGLTIRDGALANVRQPPAIFGDLVGPRCRISTATAYVPAEVVMTAGRQLRR